MEEKENLGWYDVFFCLQCLTTLMQLHWTNKFKFQHDNKSLKNYQLWHLSSFYYINLSDTYSIYLNHLQNQCLDC